MNELSIPMWEVLANLDLMKVFIHEHKSFVYDSQDHILLFEESEEYIQQLKERMLKANKPVLNFIRKSL